MILGRRKKKDSQKGEEPTGEEEPRDCQFESKKGSTGHQSRRVHKKTAMVRGGGRAGEEMGELDISTRERWLGKI